jgi:very-short-patch-repair endonuclease
VSDLEETLALLMRDAGLPDPEREYRFSDTRRFRLDFAWPAQKLGVEVQGGTWVKSGHTTGTGLERDFDKLNTLSAEGWKVLMFSRKMIESGYAVEMIKQILGNGDKYD